MFIDQAKIFVQAGNGGNGCVSFRREKFVPRGGPDGGDGGKGGNILLVASSGIKTLLDFSRQPHYRAQKGAHGSGNNRFGKAGADLILKVPQGTLVYKGDEVIGDLVDEGQSVVVARGGRGGRGNAKFKSPRAYSTLCRRRWGWRDCHFKIGIEVDCPGGSSGVS